MSILDKMQNIDRRYIYLAAWIFVLFPLHVPLGLPARAQAQNGIEPP